MAFFYFILLLGGLIFFHELGHFLTARLCGVRVLTFSLGFGPRLLTWRSKRSGTEYVVSVLPLGGFVKMLGDDPSEPVPAEERAVSFTTQPLWKRFLIVFAGPFFNLVLPVFIFFFMAFGQPVYPSTLGMVIEGGPAWQAGLRAGDRIVAIDGDEVSYWWQLQDLISDAADTTLTVEYMRDGTRQTTQVTPKTFERIRYADIGAVDRRGQIRVVRHFLEPIVVTRPGSAAEQAGLQSWDRVVAVDGKPVKQWADVESAVRTAAGGRVELTVLREQPWTGPTTAGVDLATWGAPQKVTLTPTTTDLGALGLDSAEFYVYSVRPGTPAADQIGLQRGDKVVSLDGERLASWLFLESQIGERPEQEHTITFERAGETIQRSFTPVVRTEKTEFNTDMKVIVFGAENHVEYGLPEAIDNDAPLSLAWHNATEETWDKLKLNVLAIAGLFRGNVPLKDLGGPILIYDIAGKTQEAGWEYFFQVMVMLSINLGLLNLLPIPILDGGHLMFFAIEAIKRKPVSMRTRQIATYVGFSFIILLMVLVFKNDLERKWDDILGAFR
jgi:regulator of sigma E protease